MFPKDYLDAIKSALFDMDRESSFGLRGWKKHVGRRGQDEVLITRELCGRLAKRGFSSEPRNYPGFPESCDVVSVLQGGIETWIESKLYYTIFFDDNDLNYKTPIASYSAGHWQNQIRYLVSDCSTKLLRLLPKDTPVAGLLLGFEMEHVPPLSRGRNPSSAEVDNFIRSEMGENLPGWSVHPLSDSDGWHRTFSVCPHYEFVTRPMLLMPGARN